MGKLRGVLAATLIGAGAAAGGWWAYDEGHIGENPRAPTVANFRPVVEAWAFRKDQLRPKCVSYFPDGGKGARRGWPGLATGDSMGLTMFAVTLREPEGRSQRERDRTLLRMDSLTKAGFFAASETTLPIESGEESPARQYVLTQKGWTNSIGGCLYFGRPEVLEIASMARIQPDPDGIRAYDIAYKVGVKEAPAWTLVSDAKDIFGDFKGHLAPTEHHLRLLRGGRGWLPEPLVKDKEDVDRGALSKSIDELLPPLTLERIQSLIKGHDGLDPPQACLLLPGRDQDGIVVDGGLNAPMSVTMMDADPLTPRSSRVHETWKQRMKELAKAGIFRMEPVPEDKERNRPGGMRFVLDDILKEYVSPLRPHCLQLGKVALQLLPETIEVQSRQDGTLNYRFKAVGKIAADAWSRAKDLQSIPEAHAYLQYGVPYSGYVEYKTNEWRLVSGGPAMPVVVELPQEAVSTAMAAAVPVPQPGKAAATIAKSVHVIAVYRAGNAPSTPGQAGGEGSVRVLVGSRGKPRTLVLSAYDRVHWIVEADAGVEFDRVIAMGYHQGRISGVPNAKVQYQAGYLPTSSGRRGADNLRAIPGLVEKMVGRRPDTLDTAYDGRVFNLGSARGLDTGGGCVIERSLEDGRASYSGHCQSEKSGPDTRWVAGAVRTLRVPDIRPDSIVVPVPHHREVIIDSNNRP